MNNKEDAPGIEEEIKAVLMDEPTFLRTVARISHEIIEKNKGVDKLCLVGIRRRGCTIADMIRDNIEKFEGVRVACAHIDISGFRDDLCAGDVKNENTFSIPFPITGKKVVLVDDVLYTGRTIRAAMEALLSAGRPECIRLAILIDRGHRELPIRADYIGKSIPTSRSERIAVLVREFDGENGVYLCSAKQS